jgi:hypothetical protein
MKAGALVSCSLLLTLVILLYSTPAQVTEYRKVNTEVKAEEILNILKMVKILIS